MYSEIMSLWQTSEAKQTSQDVQDLVCKCFILACVKSQHHRNTRKVLTGKSILPVSILTHPYRLRERRCKPVYIGNHERRTVFKFRVSSLLVFLGSTVVGA